MSRLKTPHVAFAVVAAMLFVAMAVEAKTFEQSAQWFPLYTGIAGAVIASATAVTGTIAVLRRNQASPEPDTATEPVLGARQEAGGVDQQGVAVDVTAPPDEPDGGRVMLQGFGWLGVWAGFVLTALVIGYIPASVIWIGAWFRTVHKWPARVVIPVAAAVLVLLLLAQNQLNMAMPGGDGWIDSAFT